MNPAREPRDPAPSHWLVEPLDPLIAGDGRTANNLRFVTTRFPFSSVLAGAARTRMASPDGAFSIPPDQHKKLNALKSIPVHGPLLAELGSEDGAFRRWLAAAPRDAFLAAMEKGDGRRALCRRLQPIDLAPGWQVDSLADQELLPVGAPGGGMEKPVHGAPAFWDWKHFEKWLRDPQDREGVEIDALGIPDFPREDREHLEIWPEERVGVDGRLFMTSGLRLLQGVPSERGGFGLPPRRFALSLRTPGGRVGDRYLQLREETAPLGGERRLARWSPSPAGWPAMPEEIRAAIVRDRRARIVLLTPAYFTDGALPAWRREPKWRAVPKVKVTLRAACVGRPEVVSGWGLGKRGGPKPSRRLAPAGSVYFVTIEAPDDRYVERWCDAVWLSPVNDREKDARNLASPQPDRDGFGLAALGVWGPG